MTSNIATRAPLEPTTNETHSPNLNLDKAAKKRPELRRKSTHHTLKSEEDSSESFFSPHSSIYDASVISSAENLDHDSHDLSAKAPTDKELPSWDNIIVGESGDAVPSSFLQPPTTKHTHIPHALDPITERSSFATLRTIPSISTNVRLSTITLLSHKPGLNGKKSKSFSVSDLPPHRPPSPPTPPSIPLPAPLQPFHPPPERIPTPPGLPSFNTPEAINYRLPPPEHRSSEDPEVVQQARKQWIKQTVGLPRGVVMRGENGTLIKGKFTPIVSGHMPPQRRAQAFHRDVEITDVVASEEPAERVGEGTEADSASHVRLDKRMKGLIWLITCCGCCNESQIGGERWRRRGSQDSPLFVGGLIPR